MDHQDRKRAFSQAFQPTSRDFGDAFRQAARSVAASSVPNTPSSFYAPPVFFSCNKENETPLFEGKDKTPRAPQAAYSQHQGLAPLAIRTRTGLSPRSPLEELSREQYIGNGISSPMLPPRARQSTPGFSRVTPPMSAAAQEPSLLGSTPPDEIDFISLLDEVLGVCLDSEPGPTIYEENDTSMCYQQIPAGPLSPSELNLQDLSLLDVPYHQLLALSSRPVQYNRASVYIVQSTIFDACFPEILPNEVVIAFDRGKKVMKVDKYPLCNQSRFFAKMLDGPFLAAHTRCIRLRNDFPYAIVAMLQFIETSNYLFDTNMLIQYPHITLLDLHIHAYLVGAKYEVPRLCEHAGAEYINIAQMILSMGVTADRNSFETQFSTDAMSITTAPSTINSSAPSSTYPAPRDPNDNAPAAVMDRFLDSLVLLWKNTPSRHDALREAVLELIKPELHQLMRLGFFVTMMMELVSFGDDIVQSLEEDGFDVKAVPVPVGMRRRWVIRFGGS